MKRGARAPGEETDGACLRYEKLYTMLLDAIPSSVLLIDRERRVVGTNRNFLEKSRRTLAETIHQPLVSVFPAVLFKQARMEEQIDGVFAENRPVTGQRVAYRAPRIPYRIYYYSILPFAWDGVVENVMLLMEDVTERVRLSEEVRRTERHLASVVESASDIVLSTDTEGRVLTWNPAAESLTGFDLLEARTRSFLDFCPRDQQPEVRKALSGMRREGDWQMVEFDLVTRLGQRCPFSWVFSPMKDDEGRTVGAVGVGRNITDHRKLEMQLLQSQKLAALGVMAGGIAHELRNPLAVCSSAAQFLMEEDCPQDFRKECADKIYKGIRRASDIIENLMKLARPAASKEMVAVDLAFILRETLMLVARQARVQNIAILQEMPRQGAMVRGMAGLLQQMFMNLFLNAIQVMPDGGTLRVAVATGGGQAVVEVSDTGPGIPAMHMDKIFDPFYTTSAVGKGMGLGLSLCYPIVKEHGGTIEADSVEGEGATFTVRLPVL